MKQKDIILILAVAFFAGVVALFLSQALFAPNETKQLQVEKVEPISSQFSEPDKTIFNENATNPTQLIQIGDGNNPSPF